MNLFDINITMFGCFKKDSGVLYMYKAFKNTAIRLYAYIYMFARN